MTTTTSPSLAALVGRVEALTGPDREVDAAVCIALFGGSEANTFPGRYFTDARGYAEAPPLTGSVDAVLSLVEGKIADEDAQAGVILAALERVLLAGDPMDWEPKPARTAGPLTPQVALALLLALLKALTQETR